MCVKRCEEMGLRDLEGLRGTSRTEGLHIITLLLLLYLLVVGPQKS